MAKISNLTELTSATDASEIVINDGTPTTKKITVANLKSSLGVAYTKLVCLISQSGTDAPTLTILENTTGATFDTVRQATGVYQITTLSSVFTANKTLILANNYRFPWVIDFSNSTTRITIGCYDGVTAQDDVLLNTSLEVRIYA